MFFDQNDSKFVSRRCLSSYSIENVKMKHSERLEQQELTSIKTSNECHLYWKHHFHKNLS